MSGKHLLSLINDILDLSRIEAGKMELRYTEVSVSRLICEVLTTLIPLASKKGISLDKDIDPQLWVLHADEAKLREILYNLTSNAIKFTPYNARWPSEPELPEACRDLCKGQRYWDIAGGPEKAVPAFQPNRHLGGSNVSGKRAWSHHCPETCGTARRKNMDRERSRKRQHVHIYVTDKTNLNQIQNSHKNRSKTDLKQIRKKNPLCLSTVEIKKSSKRVSGNPFPCVRTRTHTVDLFHMEKGGSFGFEVCHFGSDPVVNLIHERTIVY